MITFGPWLPDQPDYRGASLIEALNVRPRDDGAYGPLPGLASTSAALPARCYGLTWARDNNGNTLAFAGTPSHLYRLQNDSTWAQVSKSGGYTLDAALGERWRFTQFGDRLIVAGGLSEQLQSFNVASGSAFDDLDVTAPRAEHIASIRDFVMVGQTNDGIDTIRNQVWWSAINDATSWPAPGSSAATVVQSDTQILPDGGFIQGILAGVGGADAAIFGESRIWRVLYEGPPTVFRFDPVERSRGVYAAGSLIAVGKIAYYFSEDGWYAFDGVESVPIGAGKIDRRFINDLDDSYKDNIWAGYDVDQKLLLWAYPGAGNSAGLPNHLLIYNRITGNWTMGVINIEALGQLAAIGYTLEGLDNLGYTLDTLPASLDSRVWAGGGAYLGAVDATHKLGQFAGPNLQADLIGSEFSGQNGSRFWLTGARVYSDSTAIQAEIRYRDTNAGTLSTTGYLDQADDVIPHLVAARYGRLAVRIPAASSWLQAQGYDLEIRREGKR